MTSQRSPVYPGLPHPAPSTLPLPSGSAVYSFTALLVLFHTSAIYGVQRAMAERPSFGLACPERLAFPVERRESIRRRGLVPTPTCVSSAFRFGLRSLPSFRQACSRFERFASASCAATHRPRPAVLQWTDSTLARSSMPDVAPPKRGSFARRHVPHRSGGHSG